jgi:hypothetical protein
MIMKNLNDLVPKHKSDHQAIQLLSQLTYPEYKPILWELLHWIQDINWPIAFEIIPILKKAGDDIIPFINRIFETDDYIWQRWTLKYLVADMPIEIIKIFRPILDRLAENPNNNEKEEELDLIAQELTNKLK